MPIPSPGTIAKRLSIGPPLAARAIAFAPPAPQEQQEGGGHEAEQVGDDVPGAGVAARDERLMVFVGHAPEKHERERAGPREGADRAQPPVERPERQERHGGVTPQMEELVPDELLDRD